MLVSEMIRDMDRANLAQLLWLLERGPLASLLSQQATLTEKAEIVEEILFVLGEGLRSAAEIEQLLPPAKGTKRGRRPLYTDEEIDLLAEQYIKSGIDLITWCELHGHSWRQRGKSSERAEQKNLQKSDKFRDISG